MFQVYPTGWREENVLVQDARRPFVRRIKNLLKVGGMPTTVGLPSERRMEAGIDTCGYYIYPMLFYTAFPNISLSQLWSLSLCGSYIFDYILCLDSILDHPDTCNSGAVLLAGMLQHEALALLHQVFSPDTTFWDYFDAYHAHFVQAVLRERARHHCFVTPYSEDELRFIYAGKPAIAKACIAALALLDGQKELIEPLTASHDAFYVAFQLFDDLIDWRLDYQRRHYSYPLTWALCKAGWQQRIESDRPPEPDRVKDLLQQSGAVEQARSIALDYIDKAESILTGIPESTWIAAIRRMRQKIQQFRFDSKSTTQVIARDSPIKSTLFPQNDAIVVPVAPQWLAWLNHSRVPCIDDAQILATQHSSLDLLEDASTVGEVLCQVGLAIISSRRLYPERSLAIHLGMSEGELEWCRRNDHWLDAMLILCLNEQAHLWTPDSDVSVQTPFPGWVPPAVGRYLGYCIVQDYQDYVSGSPRACGLTTEEILSHYCYQLVT